MTYPQNDRKFSSITLGRVAVGLNIAGKTPPKPFMNHRRSSLEHPNAILEERGYQQKALADFRAMHAMSRRKKFADYWRTFRSPARPTPNERGSR